MYLVLNRGRCQDHCVPGAFVPARTVLPARNAGVRSGGVGREIADLPPTAYARSLSVTVVKKALLRSSKARLSSAGPLNVVPSTTDPEGF
jgi:hypothetical protein